ncbi:MULTISPECIES: hypothetical protein [Burkholderia cepacia complex]|uniref:hypothetical protein n=1 Tax=Burkholderia cepacia complex TaxID=87882 RepID=UPI0015947BD8|nr:MULTISPECIES: hypothetical protein [Burkholderia cepacia complex]MDN7680520.1 hypothetical protein [Burkholderia cenocepacia]UKV74407.1 hypothetical protein FOC29_23870 [Burkholderia vietnamiensis]
MKALTKDEVEIIHKRITHFLDLDDFSMHTRQYASSSFENILFLGKNILLSFHNKNVVLDFSSNMNIDKFAVDSIISLNLTKAIDRIDREPEILRQNKLASQNNTAIVDFCNAYAKALESESLYTKFRTKAKYRTKKSQQRKI